MTRAITTYECQVCGGKFATENEAVLCEQQEFSPKFKAGDIVTVGVYDWLSPWPLPLES